jgi:drug/metabolite transporter (DMT)-like permease
MSQSTSQSNLQPAAATREGLLSWTLLAFVVVTVLLGMNFVAVRFSNAELPPFWGAFLRFAVASVILFGIVGWRRLALPRGRGLTAAVIFGVLIFGLTYALMYWALLTVPSGMAAVVFAMLPLITLLLAAAVREERLTWRGVAGGLLGVAGLALAFRDQLQAAAPVAGLVAVLLAVIGAAIATIAVKRFPRSHPVSTNAVAMAVGAALLFVTSLAARETWVLPSLPATWTALAYLITSAIVAFVLMVWILTRWSASAVTYSSVLQPLVTVIGASLLAGEVVTPLFLVGGALVLGGVYVGAGGSAGK